MLPQERWGKEFDGLMHVTDWYPTLFDLANIEDDCSQCDGVSQVDALLYGSESARTSLLYDCYILGEDSSLYLQSACGVRNSQFKLLHHFSDNETDLYFSQHKTGISDDDLEYTENCVVPTSGNFTVSVIYPTFLIHLMI